MYLMRVLAPKTILQWLTWHPSLSVFTFSQYRNTFNFDRQQALFRMPRVKQKASDSLKSLCLRSISDNIDKIWSREFLQNYYGKTHYLFVLGGPLRWDHLNILFIYFPSGPFDDLPPRLIHEVLVTLKERKLLRKHPGKRRRSRNDDKAGQKAAGKAT